LNVPFGDAESLFAGNCPNCGRRLIATLSGGRALLFIFAIGAAFMQVATLPFNPRFKPNKASKLALVLEALVIRMFWRTNLVQIKASSSEP
jgi:hypothetical protein